MLFRHRGTLPLLLCVPVVSSALRGDGLDGAAAVVGAAVAATGVALRLCSVRRIGRGARVFRPHASAGLIAAGPYRWIRNPLYLAAALMLSGLGLIAGASWIALALFPATLLAYTPVVLGEERALSELLGEPYRRYLDRVSRWIGASRPWPAAPPGPLVDWSEVLRRERALVPGMIAAALAIAAVRSQWIPSQLLTRPLEQALGADLAWLVAAAFAVAVTVNGIKVELHQRRRQANRAAGADAASH
jgi:protein-S-isoprenylcysteine O-methyltransferase Ste14